jgi:hypothetical protein
MAKFTDLGPGTGEETPAPDESPFSDNGHEETEEAYDWRTIWEAPDYAQLIATRQSRKAKEYTSKANSVVKALTLASINAGDFPDAAALLHHGPPFTHAVGQWADSNDRVAAAVDIITSPSSPVLMFTVTGIALVAQIFRNHEAQLAEIPNTRKRAKAMKQAARAQSKAEPPRFTVKAFGRQWPIRIRSRFKVRSLLGGFRAQTQPPEQLTVRVFSDEKLQSALEKQGIKLVRQAPTQ